MKIYSQQTAVNNYNLTKNGTNTSFKAISPTALKQIQAVTNNKASKDIFIKLASLTGLTGIVAWVKSLTNEKQTENLEKLDIIDTNWSQKGDEIFLDKEKQGQFMDLVSKADSTESIIWTKGLMSKNADNYEEKEISNDEKELFLNPESNETFLSISANKTLNSIANQIKALSSATEEVKASAIKTIEEKLNSLIKEADKLQNSDASNEIYTKFANIFRTFALTNLINKQEKETNKEEISPLETEISETNSEQEEIEKPAIVDHISGVTGEVDYSAKDKVSLEGPKVVGKINLEKTYTKEKASNPKETLSNKKEIIITEENKDFIENIFLKTFTKRSNISPETYADQVDIIQKIYENYAFEGKERIGKELLKHFSRQNTVKELEMYKKFNNNELGKNDFRAFLELQTLKHINGGDITQEEFERLENYKDDKIKFFVIKDSNNVYVSFCNGVSASERLKILADFHKIAFNVSEQKNIKGDEYSKATSADVKEELKNKLSTNIDDYENIIRYLDIPEETLEEVAADIDDGNIEDARITLNSILNNKCYEEKINNIVFVLNNPAFENFIGGVHGRMRFIERVLFANPRNMNKTPLEMKRISSIGVSKLKEQIESLPTIDFTNYIARKQDGTSIHKYGAQVKIKEKTIGLNDRAEIHTLY